MIKSMTGYGRARQELHKRDITVEVRSVNNRYLDCTVKMPRMYTFAEDAVKKHVQQAVSRGKVDVFITVDATAAAMGAEPSPASLENMPRAIPICIATSMLPAAPPATALGLKAPTNICLNASGRAVTLVNITISPNRI